MSPTSTLRRLALTQIKHIDAPALRYMASLGVTPDDFFTLPIATLNSRLGLDRKDPFTDAEREDALRRAEEIEKTVRIKNIRTIFLEDEDYPLLLSECEDAPMVLYVFGEFPSDADHSISVVGTRRASHYGLTMAADIVKGLKDETPVVVSGLALGIDSAAHTAALECGLPTWAVLAHGLDTIYPSVNRSLAERIVRNGGALISEFPPGTRPWPRNFLIRNRIIAGLSQGTVVVESPVKGGAISTAHLVGKYHRELMAIPGRPTDMQSAGCNLIIKKGMANLIEGAKDVKRILRWYDNPESAQPTLFPDEPTQQTPVDPEQKRILDAFVSADTLSVDELQVLTGMRINLLLSVLMDMELDNLVAKLPGNRFAICAR